MLSIEIPRAYKKEIGWVLDIVFKDWLNIAYMIKVSSCLENVIISKGEGEIILSTDFFSKHYYKGSLGSVYPTYFFCKGIEKKIPILFGEPLIERNNLLTTCSIDILGFIFFMLSRYECTQKGIKLDKFGRFPATESLAFKFDFLERAIVDEYVELLIVLIRQIDNNIVISPKKGKIIVSCDIDVPYDCSTRNAYLLVKSCAGDFLKRKDYRRAFQRIINFISTFFGCYKYDPYDTFDWYLKKCKENKCSAIFYFISSDNKSKHDGCYSLNETRIKKLLFSIYRLGYTIGVHGSFYSKNSKNDLLRGKINLESALGSTVVHNRQHVLRFDHRTTPKYLEDAGFQFDSSGGYADRPGFMYGTGRSFSMWDFGRKTSLKIKQQPLILMECSVRADRYMGLSYKESILLMKKLKDEALAHGDFTFLWHNSFLTSMDDRNLFLFLLKNNV